MQHDIFQGRCDAVKREGITGISALENIFKFLSGSIGRAIWAKNISDTINSNGKKILVNMVERYLQTLCDSFILYRVDSLDIKGKQNSKTFGKNYIVDTGI